MSTYISLDKMYKEVGFNDDTNNDSTSSDSNDSNIIRIEFED